MVRTVNWSRFSRESALNRASAQGRVPRLFFRHGWLGIPPPQSGAIQLPPRQASQAADTVRPVHPPVVARYRDLDIEKYFRGDAAFAIP